MKSVLESLQEHIATKLPVHEGHFTYPPPIAKSLGFELTAIDVGTATIQMKTDPARHANPMGTVHGGVVGDIADAAIGTAHATTLAHDESFTSIDLKVNFFKPVWITTLTAIAKPVHKGNTVSHYECNVTDEKGKLVAFVTSTVMTLRGDSAKGR